MRQYISPGAGRPPKSISAGVARSMKSNRASGTKPELILSRLLRKKIQKNSFPGRPDFVFPRKKVAVFVHGCFWHRCPQCNFDLPKANRDFWAKKFNRNIERDRLVRQELEAMGWSVIEVWEHELRIDPIKIAAKIIGFIKPLEQSNISV